MKADKKRSENGKKDGVLASVGYRFGSLILSLDGGYYHAKNVKSSQLRARAFKTGFGDGRGYFVSPGFQLPLFEQGKIYGNYLYQHLKTLDKTPSLHEKTRGFLLGTGYKLHKKVIAYLEGKYLQTQAYRNGETYGRKITDKTVGIGMRVFF